MRSKYILFALALTGALASCSDDDNKGTANYNLTSSLFCAIT